MKAEMAQEIQKTFTDMNMYRGNFVLNDIYSGIRKSALTRVGYYEHFIPWNKNAEPEDRASIVRAIYTDLKANGYKVVVEGEKGKYSRLKIWW